MSTLLLWLVAAFDGIAIAGHPEARRRLPAV
jgi:hypothetical protein